MHLYQTRPSSFASNGRCMGICSIKPIRSIKSNKDGGNIIYIISSLQIAWMIFISSFSMCWVCNLFKAYIYKKKWLIFMSAFHILFDNKSRWVNEINVCINTWQSWLFIPYNLPSFKFINLDMLKHIHQENVDS